MINLSPNIKKTSGAVLALGLVGLAETAQAQASAGNAGMLEQLAANDAFLWAVLAIEGLLIALAIVLLFTVLKVKTLLIRKEAAAEGVEAVQEKSFLDAIKEKLSDANPMEQEKDFLLDHDYDGIHELDNNLPPWWKLLFNISIAFGIIYLGVYHVFDIGQSAVEEYNYEMAQAEIEVAEYMATKANSVDENTVEFLADNTRLENGKQIFMQNCAACHGRAGEGGVGPNMTDNYWLHGNDIKDIFKTIKYGVPEKGMISWKQQLTPAQMQDVSSFIVTMHGTNPPNAKEPQGELYEAAPAEEMTGEGQETENTTTSAGEISGQDVASNK